ncbi:hypothetical protein AZH53_10935 [Methanomicrobiaceae archaeon CYW5]|nr:hypothetical protein [Methanovulcanius yangii]
MYSTRDAVYAIESPVKQDILSMLEEEGALSFDEITGRLGKAKSTVSVHLKGLSEDGVVDVRTDPDDGRRKTYRLSGRRVGALSVQDRSSGIHRQPESADEFADVSSLYRFMCCQFRIALMDAGVNIEPIMRSVGESVGRSVAKRLDPDDLSARCAGLSEFWERYGLGQLSVVSYEPLVIIATGCFECSDLPHLGRPVCAFGKGVFGAIFSDFYKMEVTVAETRCYGMGNEECRFEITVDEENDGTGSPEE